MELVCSSTCSKDELFFQQKYEMEMEVLSFFREANVRGFYMIMVHIDSGTHTHISMTCACHIAFYKEHVFLG